MSDRRMSRTLASLARRRGRLPALVAALAIAAYLALKLVLGVLLGYVTSSAYASASFSTANGLYELESGPSLATVVAPILEQVLPFAVGVFVALWLIAPLAGELTLRFVLTRGALATAAGALLVILVGVVIAFIYGFATVDRFGELRIGGDFFDLRGFAHGVVLAADAGARLFLFELVAVLFASALLWLWLRDHPRDYAVSGLIDEV